MIITRYLYDNPENAVDAVQYFGEDLKEFPARDEIKKRILEDIYKECETNEGYKGFIIGVEDNFSYNDYYYIIWIPQTEKIEYMLVNGMSNYIK